MSQNVVTPLGCAVILALWTGYATAQDFSGCEKFAWLLKREQAWFSASGKASVKSGATIEIIPNSAIVIALEPASLVKLAMPPERRASEGFGGSLSFPAVEQPGLYQITTSDDAWIDVIQDSQYAKSIGSTGRRDCPGLRKSVRFFLRQAPFILQLSGVVSETIIVAVSSAD